MFSLFGGLVASGGSDLWRCLDTEPLQAGSGEHPGMGNRGFVCSPSVKFFPLPHLKTGTGMVCGCAVCCTVRLIGRAEETRPEWQPVT